jgi:sarcosine oxidase subunit alpha
MILRMEKGFLHIGIDTDVSTNPIDIGFGNVVAAKKGDFIGARSLERSEDRRIDRRNLVGCEALDASATILAGAHFVTATGGASRSEGFVTSACRSPTHGKTIGIGQLERGFERTGDVVEIYDQGCRVAARIVDICFYDPTGEMMRG